jgi:hypothetical protein
MEPGQFQGVKTSQYRLFERFRKQPEPEKRFAGCIRYVHSPFRRFVQLSSNVTGHIAKDHRCFFMGSAHVGQIDVVVAGMIPVANVEAKVRHAAVLVAPQQSDPENSHLLARLPTRKATTWRVGWGPRRFAAVAQTPRCWQHAQRQTQQGRRVGNRRPVIVGLAGRCVAARSVALAMRCRALR